MPTLLQPGREPVAAAAADQDGAWVSLTDLHALTGWESKQEGICRDDICVPLPPGRTAEFVRDGRLNFVAFARHLGGPAEYHEPTATWAVGESAEQRASALQSLEAPDFTLPGLDGRLQSLSDYRGRRVFLVSWASW